MHFRHTIKDGNAVVFLKASIEEVKFSL